MWRKKQRVIVCFSAEGFVAGAYRSSVKKVVKEASASHGKCEVVYVSPKLPREIAYAILLWLIEDPDKKGILQKIHEIECIRGLSQRPFYIRLWKNEDGSWDQSSSSPEYRLQL